MLTHGAACTLEHTISLPNIGIYCSVQYSGLDCPLGPDPVVCCREDCFLCVVSFSVLLYC